MRRRIVNRGFLVVVLASVAGLGIALTRRTPGSIVCPEKRVRAPGPEQDPASCRQYDCWASGLTWHTVLEEAKAEARASGKAILSLRLLGRLDEDLSCANSRLFRTLLYPDPRVAHVLRDQFVLHWHSVRPTPHLTVDFADGRKIVKTLTGNSVHYVLDAEGRVIDALPGVYSPPAFLRALETARQQALAVGDLDIALWSERMVVWNGGASTKFLKIVPREPPAPKPVGFFPFTKPKRTMDPLASGPFQRLLIQSYRYDLWRRRGAPYAIRADESYKRDNEYVPLASVAGLEPGRIAPILDERQLQLARDRQQADQIGDELIDEARLSEESLAVMCHKLGIVAKPMVEATEVSIAHDSAYNDTFRHRVIREQLSKEPYGADLAALDTWIYSAVFMSPLDDPWYGLVDANAYAALDGNGLVIPQR